MARYSKEETAELYRDYFNNFLTVKRFAEYYGMREQTARYIITFGRIAHEENINEGKTSCL
jgi:transposase-like protein